MVPVITARQVFGLVNVKPDLKGGRAYVMKYQNSNWFFLTHSVIRDAGKYLPRDFLLWNGETSDFAAWVVKLSGLHMVLVLFLCSADGLARGLICCETCRIQCVCKTQSWCKYENRQNSGTQCWCIFCCKVLRFQRVYNPLQSSGWLDNLQRHHMRWSWACTDQTRHLGRACLQMRPGKFMNGQNCLIFFHHYRQTWPGQTWVTTCSSSRASLFIIATGFISSSLSSRSVMLASLRRKAYRVKIKLQTDFREHFWERLTIFCSSFICRHTVQTLKETPWIVFQLIALFLATLLTLSIWAVQSIAKQLRWVVLVCDLLYFWTVSCMRRSVFPFCSLCRDTRYLSFIRASQDSTSSSWLFDNSISWQVQNKPMWGIL